VSTIHLALSHTLTSLLASTAAVSLETPWPAALAMVLALLGAVLTATWMLWVRRSRRWVRAHVRVAVGAAPNYWCGVSEVPGDASPPTLTVRIESHPDPGRQLIEEVEA
jgi:hypothetical protein